MIGIAYQTVDYKLRKKMIKDLQMNEMRRNNDAMEDKCLYQNF